VEFRAVSLEQLALFFAWLRRPPAARRRNVFVLPGAPAALASATMLRKRAAVAGFYRFHSRRDQAVAPLLGELVGPRPTGSFVPMLVHTHRGAGRDTEKEYSPLRLRADRKIPSTLTGEQADAIISACTRLRDRFLVRLLLESGLRLGEALGLRHGDLRLRRAEIEVVPRPDNVNQARVKGLKPRRVPVRETLFDLYADYMELEYGSRDCDYVFINLFADPVGAAMTRSAVAKLTARLGRRAGVGFFTPHVARHTYATDLLRRGVPAHVVADLLGHSSAQTTQSTYAHLTTEDHRRLLVAAGVLDGPTR
jgi:integrase